MLCVRMRGRRSIQRHHQITRARAIKRQVAAARGVATLLIGYLSSFLFLRVHLSSFLFLRVRADASVASRAAAVLDWAQTIKAKTSQEIFPPP